MLFHLYLIFMDVDFVWYPYIFVFYYKILEIRIFLKFYWYIIYKVLF